MRTVIYTCPYVPPEWIAEHGLRAERLLLDRADSTFAAARTEGVCPYVRSFVFAVMKQSEAAGVLVTTVCDQMRRAFDILFRRCDIPTFLMNVPNTWQSVAAQKLYLDELKRLGLFLVQVGGQSPPDDILAGTMLRYDNARNSIRAARPYLSARRYAEVIAAFGKDGSSEMLSDVKGSEPLIDGVPLAIVGGPLMRQDFELFDIVEQSGGRIVLDGSETGERGMCATFDRRRLCSEPLMELADAYFGNIPDASRRP
ncbi:MAG: 2-hydroxyacyl-CoA dehydratase family protein, partial [Sedimentisphaerales bacterium]